jgi:hypothetical protein
MHSSGGTYARYLQDMTDYIEWLDVEMNVEEADSYTWAFVGNVFDGFILVNYAAGAEKGVNSDGADNPALGDIETATQWQIKGSRVNRDSEHFCFQYPGSNKYMNAQNGKVAFWSDNDQGSTMWVTERDLTGATELQAYIDEVEAMIETGVAADDAVGYVSFYSLTEVGIALTADDFDYSEYAHEYMKVFIEESEKGNVYTEKIKDTFEKLYIRCSELIMHISLNIRSLYHRNEKNIDKFYVLKKEHAYLLY